MLAYFIFREVSAFALFLYKNVKPIATAIPHFFMPDRRQRQKNQKKGEGTEGIAF